MLIKSKNKIKSVNLFFRHNYDLPNTIFFIFTCGGNGLNEIKVNYEIKVCHHNYEIMKLTQKGNNYEILSNNYNK